jgi:hypothetical protein
MFFDYDNDTIDKESLDLWLNKTMQVLQSILTDSDPFSNKELHPFEEICGVAHAALQSASAVLRHVPTQLF